MSYDLMVFDTKSGPTNAADLEAWFQAKMEEVDECLIQDPEATTPALRAWYADMIKDFPDYNAALSVVDLGDTAAGYSSCATAIYVDFRWPKAEVAYRRVSELARKHGLGFFDVSGPEGQVWVPDDFGELVLVFQLKQ